MAARATRRLEDPATLARRRRATPVGIQERITQRTDTRVDEIRQIIELIRRHSRAVLQTRERQIEVLHRAAIGVVVQQARAIGRVRLHAERLARPIREEPRLAVIPTIEVTRLATKEPILRHLWQRRGEE